MRSLVLTTAVALLVVGLPAAALISANNRAGAVTALVGEATRALALGDLTATPPSVPAPVDDRVTTGVYDAGGTLVAGAGPATDPAASGALTEGAPVVETQSGDLVVYVPFDRDPVEQRVTIRVQTPLAVTRDQTYLEWAALAGLLLLGVGVAALVAVRRARVLATPFERLARAAEDLRGGAFALAIGPTGVREGDEVAQALETAARSAADRVDRARALAADTSHQVRTPIAAARVTLESALTVEGSDLDAAARAAVAQLDRASTALGEVLDLSAGTGRPTAFGPVEVDLSGAFTRWAPVLRAGGRELRRESDSDLEATKAPEAVLRQCLDVLLDNATAHGRGTVRLGARVIPGWLIVDVGDEGTVLATSELETGEIDIFARGEGAGTGLGLSLARSLARSVGGRLVLAETSPTRFSLVLPTEVTT